MTLPANHIVGQSGHTTDHNTLESGVNDLVDTTTAQAAAIADEVVARQTGDANASAQAIAEAHSNTVTAINDALAGLSGAAVYDPSLTYSTSDSVAYGTGIYTAAVNVLTDLPMFGRGDGSADDQDLLIARAEGAAVGVPGGLTGGQGGLVCLVNSEADTTSGSVLSGVPTGTFRYVINYLYTNNLAGWVKFDATKSAGAGWGGDAGATGRYDIVMTADIALRHSAGLTIDGRGADVRFHDGGTPGKKTEPTSVSAWSAGTSYGTSNGSIDSPSYASTGGVTYVCVSNIAAVDATNPASSPRWFPKIAYANGVSYPLGARVTDSGVVYVLVNGIGGLNGGSGGVYTSLSTSSTAPHLDVYDGVTNPTGHWAPIGTRGFTFYIGATDYGDYVANGSVPASNIIIEKISFQSNSGGENGNSANRKDVQVGWWSRGIWFDRCLFTNPDRNHDGLCDIETGATQISFTWCRFFRHWKACLINGQGFTAGSVAVTLAVAATSSATDVYINVPTSALPAVPFPLEFEHSNTSRDEIMRATAVDTADPSGFYKVTVVRGTSGTSAHSHSVGAVGTAFAIPNLPPGFESAYSDVTISDPSGSGSWIAMSVSYGHCMFEEVGFRAPFADFFNTHAHAYSCHYKNGGRATDVGGNIIFPCIPGSIAPSTGTQIRSQSAGQVLVENCSFETAAGATSSGLKEVDNVPTGSRGYSKTTGSENVTGVATFDPDYLPTGGLFVPSWAYTLDAANSTLRGRVDLAAGPVKLWTYTSASQIKGAIAAYNNSGLVGTRDTIQFGSAFTLTDNSGVTPHRVVVESSTPVGLLANIPTATNGALFFAIDDNGGTLYRGNATPAWVKDLTPGTKMAEKLFITSNTYSTASTTPVAVDATNLTLTFVVPYSQLVDIELAAQTQCITAAADLSWTLLDVSDVEISGNSRMRMWKSTAYARLTYKKRLDFTSGQLNVAAGTSYTIHWGYLTSNASDSARITVGSTDGPAVMRAFAA